jgi:ATP-dependent RNA helicase RhlE
LPSDILRPDSSSAFQGHVPEQNRKFSIMTARNFSNSRNASRGAASPNPTRRRRNTARSGGQNGRPTQGGSSASRASTNLHAKYPALPADSPVAAAFEALGIGPALSSAVHAAGYEEPTPIQHAAIGALLERKDLLGCAQTGTGKTAAFALPILEGLLQEGPPADRKDIRVLVLAPTRELALQIADSFCKYGRNTPVRAAVVFGGVGKMPQIDQLRRGVDVLVATPGRLLDLMGDGEVHLGSVQTFVLDEADRMLDMGFIRDVRKITARLPGRRQTLLFSATMPQEIRKLAGELLHTPVSVAVDPVSSASEPIEQSVLHVEKADKPALLGELLKDPDMTSTLVFTRTKHGANRLVEKLARYDVRAAAIHGNKSQSARQHALEQFKAGKISVLVATDIAARGIDVKGISHVVNFELPNEPESYVHRIGRTGRAGRAGVAIAFCARDERSFLLSIERLTNQRIGQGEFPEGFRATASAPSSSSPTPRGANNGRPSGPSRPRGAGGSRPGSQGGGGRGRRPIR